jgi:type IV pilus assembly protein PilC
MAVFEYVVKDQSGQRLTGKQEAASMDAVVSSLREQQHIIISVRETKGGKKGEPQKGQPRGRGAKVKQDHLVVFARQFATMVSAGVPLAQSLKILAEQTESPSLRAVVDLVHRDVEGGLSLSEALSKHPRVFSALFVNMTRAGESSGKLEEILDRLAGYIEKSAALQKKVKSALIYPAVVSSMAVLITVGMLTWVIPKFADIFTSLDAPLPAPTQWLISVSNFMRLNIIYIFFGTMAFGFFLMKFLKTKTGRRWFDGFKLRMPVFGPLFLKVAVSRFTRTLSTLVKSGVSILNALEIVAKTAGNVRIEAVVDDVRKSIKEGESISGPMAKGKLFPPMVVRMIAIGEETGELDKMLEKISDFYDMEVDNAVSGLTSIIEPLVIAFLGIVIGGIVIAMFLPILTLTSHI